MNKNTVMYQLTETSLFMMSFVIVTKQNNVIVVDGGRPADMPLLKQYVAGRHISAWILTHAHEDHISGFISEYKKNKLADFDVEAVYYNFPPMDIIDNHDVRDYEYFRSELLETLPSFLEILPELKDKARFTVQGDCIQIDEVKIEFIFSYHEGLTNNLMNDSSLVFKLTTPNTSVIFLGDIGPDAGDVLYFESKDKLKEDMVQMAHHGGLCCGMEVYAAIEPKVCLWCCREESYNGLNIPKVYYDKEKMKKLGWLRMHPVTVTRRWMEQLGVEKHYVTKDGTNEIIL